MFDRHRSFYAKYWKGPKWREATLEESCACVCSIDGEWGYVCTDCQMPLDATDDVRILGDDDRRRTYVCHTCRVFYPYMWDCEEAKPAPQEVVEQAPVAETQKDEFVVHESNIDTKHEVVYHIPENLRYLLS